jgi:hypothetical protein
MADTQQKIQGQTKIPILLGSDTSFSVENLSGEKVAVSRKDAGVHTGFINVGDVRRYDYDVEVWCLEDTHVTDIGIVRY